LVLVSKPNVSRLIPIDGVNTRKLKICQADG
jgi:hypothetical protein